MPGRDYTVGWESCPFMWVRRVETGETPVLLVKELRQAKRLSYW